jgi:hypothetical protein
VHKNTKGGVLINVGDRHQLVGLPCVEDLGLGQQTRIEVEQGLKSEMVYVGTKIRHVARQAK